ncbi:MAG: ABC transporter permease [Ferruginibacter sp.]
MFKNYFKIALRQLKRNKIFSFINISGLSIGLTCCMLILLYIKDEISYDQFHEKKYNIYQLVCDRVEKDGLDTKSAIAAMVQGPAFKQAIPQIQEFTRVNHKQVVVRKENHVFNEDICWADENFFSVFSFPLIAGNKEKVLSGLKSMVLTTETAKKYFGTTDVVNKTIDLQIDGRFETFTITGIAKQAPQNSSIKFSIVIPFKYLEKVNPDNGWSWFSYPTFFVINPSANFKTIKVKMEQVYQLAAKSEIDMNHEAGYDTKFQWGLIPFTQMHLNTQYQGTPEASDPIYTYILTGISIFILLIACINFINLSIAQSLRRSKEIGIRKVIGGIRGELIRQFLGESMFVCMISFLLAILITFLILPFFNELSNKQLSIGYLFDIKLLAGIIALYLITFLAAGFYPAMVLSALNPVEALYCRVNFGGKNNLLKSLVILQFALATLLIIATLFINAQFKFLTNTELGYNDKNLVEFVADKAVMDKPLMDVCKAAFTNVTGVETVAYSNAGKFGGKTRAGNREFDATYQHIDENYLSALQTHITAGRNFSSKFSADFSNSVLINETFAKDAGWNDPVGKTVDFMNLPGWGARKITVIGLVKDFHFESLKEKIKPALFTMETQLPLGRFITRINPANIPATISALEKTYHKLFPDNPFQYTFRNDSLKKNYESESNWKQIISFAALMTIVISCIGLFGLAMLTTERRLKEIAIRKLLGASTFRLVQLISAAFVKLVCIAFFIAIPIGWFIVNKWLQNFAYRIDLSWWIFAIAGMIALLIALVTVSFHAIKASFENPVRSLKNR